MGWRCARRQGVARCKTSAGRSGAPNGERHHWTVAQAMPSAEYRATVGFAHRLLDATASHEVIVPLEDMTRAVPAIWFPGPLFDVARRLSMRSSGRALPRRSIDRRSAFFSFDPLQRPTHDAAGSSRPLGRRHQAPPMRFLSPTAIISLVKPLVGFQPNAVPPRRFARPRGVLPHRALQPCFMPLSLLGLSPSEHSSHGQALPSSSLGDPLSTLAA